MYYITKRTSATGLKFLMVAMKMEEIRQEQIRISDDTIKELVESSRAEEHNMTA